jgi:hypothetical protein
MYKLHLELPNQKSFIYELKSKNDIVDFIESIYFRDLDYVWLLTEEFNIEKDREVFVSTCLQNIQLTVITSLYNMFSLDVGVNMYLTGFENYEEAYKHAFYLKTNKI